MNLLLIILIGLSLSMDTFSLSLSLGTFNIKQQKVKLYVVIVGLLHFLLPLLGYLLAFLFQKVISIPSEKLMLFVFIFIAIEMIINIFSYEEKTYDFQPLNMFLCAISVSIDSFSIGIGYQYGLLNALLCSGIFLLFSSFFTYLGFKMGKICQDRLGKMAKILGLIIIIILIVLQF